MNKTHRVIRQAPPLARALKPRIRHCSNGLRVITEKIEAVRSCGVGIWIQVGSRHETPDEAGLSHFIEHMLFKGTRDKDARHISDAINYLGGNVNAFTSQEMVCLHARTVDHKAAQALDLLAELLTDSIFPQDELLRERKVVMEEYLMYEDSPDDLSVDLFIKNLWPEHPLGRPILGTRSSIRQFSRPAIVDYWQRVFDPSRVVISIAGAYDPAACNQVIRRRFGALKSSGAPLADPATPGSADAAPRQTTLHRPIEQTHFCLGCLAPDRQSADRYPFALLNMILGSGSSSRLFQEIREKRGLAYSIGSFSQSFSDHGYFAVSGGVSPATHGEVLRITLDEMARICEEAVSEEELVMAREQIVDSILMGQENTESRMTRLADSLMTYGRHIPVDEVLRKFEAIGCDDVLQMARRYLKAAPLASATISPKGSHSPRTGRLSLPKR